MTQANEPSSQSRGLGPGQEVDESLRDRDGTGARTPAAVGRGEGLVQVHVHDVKAHVARTHGAEDRVQVRAVVVEQSTDVVHRRGDLGDLLFEESERVGVGQHDAGDVGTERGFQLLEVNQPAVVRRNRRHLVAAEGHRGGVGAVGRVGDEDPRRASPLAL